MCFRIIVQPFLEADNIIQSYFLDREYAILIPVTVGVVVLSALMVLIGQVMMKSKKY